MGISECLHVAFLVACRICILEVNASVRFMDVDKIIYIFRLRSLSAPLPNRLFQVAFEGEYILPRRTDRHCDDDNSDDKETEDEADSCGRIRSLDFD